MLGGETNNISAYRTHIVNHWRTEPRHTVVQLPVSVHCRLVLVVMVVMALMAMLLLAVRMPYSDEVIREGSTQSDLRLAYCN